jgi:hypothetical protein
MSRMQAQFFDKSINKDSLLQSIIKDLPVEKRDELLEQYNGGSAEAKDFLLFMFSMPRSSKQALIRNIDSNYDKIAYLKREYAKFVPKNYIVLIEFNPENKLTHEKESIDLRITHSENGGTQVFQDWRLDYNSDKLSKMLEMIHWDTKALTAIKKLLADAHCVSIENGEPATIGFARSGMGKYSYKLFDQDLTSGQFNQYNNGCNYIFYKRNIVLEYGGGAIGSQCFPD